tara:strand:- start:293 stop:445 length:153 start_codon:yes stop_codon:yes gene_type:complete
MVVEIEKKRSLKTNSFGPRLVVPIIRAKTLSKIAAKALCPWTYSSMLQAR